MGLIKIKLKGEGEGPWGRAWATPESMKLYNKTKCQKSLHYHLNRLQSEKKKKQLKTNNLKIQSPIDFFQDTNDFKKTSNL